MIIKKPVDLATLSDELTAAGINLIGSLVTYGIPGGTLLAQQLEDGTFDELPPEATPVVDAHVPPVPEDVQAANDIEANFVAMNDRLDQIIAGWATATQAQKLDVGKDLAIGLQRLLKYVHANLPPQE